MREKSIIKLSLAISVIGVSLLFIISTYVNSENIGLESFYTSEKEDYITISGNLLDFETREGLTILKLNTCDIISAIAYDNISQISLNTSELTIKGKISMFNGKKQILIEEIKQTPRSAS